jgi:MFS family permease
MVERFDAVKSSQELARWVGAGQRIRDMASTSSKNAEEKQKTAQAHKASPRWHHLIGITLATALILFIFAFSSAIWGPNIGPLSQLLHSPVSKIEIILELWGLGYIPGALLGGLLLDRFGPRIVFLIASLILAGGLLAFLLSLALFGQFASFVLILILICIAGIGGGLVDSSTNGTISSVYAKKRGIALNLFSMIYPVGGLLITLVDGGLLITLVDGGLLAKFHNSPLPSFIFVLGFAFLALFSLLGIPAGFRIPHGTTSLKSTIKSAPALLGVLVPVIGVMTPIEGVYVSIYTWSPNYLHVAFGVTAAIGAFLTSGIWIADGLSRLGTASIISRIGSWKIIMIGMVVGLVGLILLAFSPNTIIAAAAFALTMIGISPIYGTSLTIAGERTERSLGSATSIMLFISSTFNLFYIWFFGFLLHTVGPIWPVLLSIAFVIVGTLIALFWLRPHYP